MLAAEFPHKTADAALQVAYLRNLLRIPHYAPAISGQVLGLIVDRILQIDVCCSTSAPLTLQVDIQTELDEQDAAQSPAPSGSSADSASVDGAAAPVQDMLAALDAMLAALLGDLVPVFAQAAPRSTADAVFGHLLGAFEDVVLQTFRSRYTQFVVFWAAQTDCAYTARFLRAVLGRALDAAQPHVARRAACAYIASFVARAASLSRDAVRRTVDALCTWTAQFLDEWQESEGGHPGVQTFYVVVQALLYIFCFRWRELANDDPQDGAWLASLGALQRATASELAPVGRCSATVVAQFGATAERVGFVWGGAAGGTGVRVDAYFPFDPCRLAESRRFIDPVYREWEDT
ncbi:hypothetical protein PMAC_002479 [Pneumocystis sp. 'macacae']|nr:hypothetical protein PMAC_002479 [Pneumocystis sp. 'macacae']